MLAPLIYVYNTDTVKNADGDKVAIDADITSGVFGGGISVVKTKKLLGANYGFEVLLPVWANNRIQGTEIDANPGAGLTDSALVPVSLGWHFKRADAVANYTIYVPTGRYEDGADDNTGMGMWGQEVGVGTTVYLNEARQYHAATLASITWQSEKKDSDTKVGTAMNFEGGVGADFLKGGLTVGLDYYASFKLTKDRLGDFPLNIGRLEKAGVFGLGPEVSLALAKGGTLYGSIKVSYQWETYAKAQTQGSTFVFLSTWFLKPIQLP